jgi:hypothetical protein
MTSESSKSNSEYDAEKPRDPLSLVKDPLSEVTRKERRTLLGVSAIGVAMVKANLIPQKISALGIDFQQINQTLLLRSIAFVILFFLIAFLIYSTSDFLTWRIAYQKVVEELAKNKDGTTGRGRDRWQEYSLEQRFIDSSVGPVSILRALFEFVFPIMVAIYAVVVLFSQ